jgi:putative glycosyltransferase (TIGR04372 family)
LDTTWLKKGEEFLEKLKIKKNSKIICLIVRDTNYLQLKFPTKNWNYQNHRNCDLSNYEMAIKYAMDKGYYVFHMGDKPKNYLDLEDKKFIQYAKNYRTDFLDIYLAYKCEFCITMGTGWDAVASYNFRKPMVWTNLLPIADPIAYSNKFIFSPKLYFSEKENRYLSLREIKDLGLSFKNHLNDFSELNISLIENTPVEIMDMTKEMIEILNNKAEYTSADKSRQEKLLKLYKELFSYKWGNNINQFSRMSKEFINKNQFLIKN